MIVSVVTKWKLLSLFVDTPLYLALPLPTVYEHHYIFECTHRTVIEECEEIFTEIAKKCIGLQMKTAPLSLHVPLIPLFRLRLTLVFATANYSFVRSFVVFRLSGTRIQGQQTQQRRPNVPLPRHLL
ncbi:hypothetical protein GOODEAATRI_034228 [Goodea atripinnis]|uniref:Secreted protein n=1 Tax=Goodea atripinnis TaxID=208336 RepID=A0ABV0NG31_9TELE